MDGRRLGSMDLDSGVNVVASARPPIVEPMKTRMETFETSFIVLLLFVIAVVILVVVVLVVLVIATLVVIVVVVVVAIAIAAPVVNVPSMVVSSTRRRMTMTTIMEMAEVRRRMIAVAGDAAVTAGNFASRH